MEGFNLTHNETMQINDFSVQRLRENRVQALKSLALLFLNELNLLEDLQFQKEEILSDGTISLSEEVEKFEIELIRMALARAKGNQRLAARLLQTKTSTLCTKIKRYGIESQGITIVPSNTSTNEILPLMNCFG